MIKRVLVCVIISLAFFQVAQAQYQGWQHSGSLCILTTPEGANLPATASEDNFPVLVRLNKEWFDFSQAKVNGEDIRFTAAAGIPLVYQIDEWDPAAGTASIWVRIPNIKGNTQQEIKMFWGKADAGSESSGKAVFNESNGYLSVWHMNDPAKDEVGTLDSKDTGTTASSGMIGKSRRFDVGKGINCGEKNTGYPTGSSPRTTEAWFRAERPNATVLAWGNEEWQGKVMLQFVSPPHAKIECYFSSADVTGSSRLATSQWVHVVHAFKNGESKVYVNGVLDGVTTATEVQLARKNPARGASLAIKSPSRMYIGGWYNNYQFAGDIDEVRISRVTRSADWVKLQYENQKPMQTLVGHMVQPGNDFSVSESKIDLAEGKNATLTAKAGGAQKVYWIIRKGNTETIAAVDRYSYTFEAGRVTGETDFLLQFKAIYANEVKTSNIPVKIHEEIPEPVFTLRAPAAWNGRDAIEVVPEICNLEAMQAKGAGELKYKWSVSGGAVVREIKPGRLLLKRSQCSGKLTVRLVLNNGGADYASSASIQVTEPRSDPWVQRAPGRDEKPVDNQFYARDDKNEGTLYYNGTLSSAAESVFLKVYAGEKLIKTEKQKPASDNGYAFTVRIKPGLIKYKVEFGTINGNSETLINTVTNLVCGDAYLIDGQSNAVATDYGKDDVAYSSDWIRSFSGGDAGKGWGNAVRRRGRLEIGYWAMDLAKHLVETQKIPICIMNGAVGGTRIDQHMPDPDNHYNTTNHLYSIYGNLLTRVAGAGLTHGIRGVLWHQGEADQAAHGPDGGYGWETYEQYFVDLSAAWKQDYPNIQHYYHFQIWPDSCSMGHNGGASDKLRDVQRLLPRLYSNMSVVSTLGIKPEGPCHFPAAGYAEMARLVIPLVEQYNYGKVSRKAVTPPDLQKAYYTSDKRDEIALEFDQPMAWSKSLVSEFYLDGERCAVKGSASGKIIKLKLASSSAARTVSYLFDNKWDSKNLLYGKNGIATLTFYSVLIAPSAEREPASIRFEPTLESLKQYETPEWFKDAKLGIYMHWGPQSVPGVDATWYARRMYEPSAEAFRYHVATYGHQSKFGYKDICKLFKAPKFDQAQADRLVELYKKTGARYVVPVAVHHDNFDMWDSKYQPRFNSVVMSGKDIVGMWKKAVDKHGLHLGVASHNARTYRWFQASHGSDRSGPMAGVPYDGQDPEYKDLYGVKWKHSDIYPDFWYEQMSDVGPPEFEKNFEDRMLDLIDKYHPDLYYTDGGIPFHHAGLNILAHLYNENQKWNNGKLQAVATIKLDWTPNIAINNYEFGYPSTVQHYAWQSDKTMGADWYWIRNATARYMSAENAIHMLIDTVSKNGNLLLNVPLTPEGELEPETVTMLTKIGECLDIIGEAVFSSRCWVVADDGGGGIRFTRNKENTVLYVINLGWSNDQLVIRALGSSRIDLKDLESVTLLGSPEKLAYTQAADGLSIKTPKRPLESPAYAFKLKFKGQIPAVKEK